VAELWQARGCRGNSRHVDGLEVATSVDVYEPWRGAVQAQEEVAQEVLRDALVAVDVEPAMAVCDYNDLRYRQQDVKRVVTAINRMQSTPQPCILGDRAGTPSPMNISTMSMNAVGGWRAGGACGDRL
jgi:hypothetical protein